MMDAQINEYLLENNVPYLRRFIRYSALPIKATLRRPAFFDDADEFVGKLYRAN